MALLSCGSADEPVQTDSGDSGTVPTTPAAVTGTAVLSDPVSCADASARESAFYNSITPPPQEPVGEGNWLLSSAGVVVADFDGNGGLDMFLPHENEGASHLWMSSSEGPGVNATQEANTRLAGIDLTGAVGGTAVDVDADGDFDLYVTRWLQPNALLRNDGNGHFTDVTEAAGMSGQSWRTQTSSWADFDGDGDLDVFAGSYGTKPEADFDDPTLLPSQDRSELWQNNGDGTFTDASDLLDSSVHEGYTFMSTWNDVNADGYPELFVWNDFGTAHPSRVLKNINGESFEIHLGSGQSGIDRLFEDMGVAVGDVNGDQIVDFAATSFKKINLLTSAPSSTSALGITWVNSTGFAGLTVDTTDTSDLGRNQNYGWGAHFGDLDHDRDEDLVALFGYWSTYPGPQDPRFQADGVWIHTTDSEEVNSGLGSFEDLAHQDSWGMNDPGIGRGLVLADLNDDGFLDVIKRTLDGPVINHSSHCGDSAWLKVDLRRTDMNVYGIGSRITVTSPDGHRQTRWISAGSSGMYGGGPPVAHFGLAQDETVDIDVQWPDMSVTHFIDVPTRRKATLFP